LQQWQHKRLNFGVEVIVGIGLLFLIVGYAVWRHPGSVSHGGGANFAVIYTLLLAFGVAAMAVRRTERPMTRAALRRGSIVGLLVGTVAVLNTSIDQFLAIAAPLRQAAMLGTMTIIVVLFATTAVWAGKRTTSRPLAVVSSLWAAVVGGVITCLYSFAGNLAFLRVLDAPLHAGHAESGISVPADVVVRNTLEAVSSHLLVSPVLALAAGIAGAWIAAYLLRFGYARRRWHGR
jgi:hypothetical protein